MLFSAIVPVYNVDFYLEKCIESILNQSEKDYEIILIDDGSKDRSGIICDEYGKKYNQVKVFHKKNEGLSCARNDGIRKANGEYILFIDGDDWIDKDSLRAFRSIIERNHPDVIETILVEEYDGETVVKDSRFTEYLQMGFSRERAIEWILNISSDTWPAPKRICRRKFIIDNNLFFADGRLQEDVDWTARLCCSAKTFCGYDRPWYHYRMKRQGSISNSINAKYITDIIEMASIDRAIYDSTKPYTIKAFLRIMCSVYMSINLIKYCNDDERKKVSICIKENMWILDYCPKRKYKMFSFAARLLGVDNALKMLSKI